MNQSMQRIGAMILRHTYVLMSSWPRLFELMFWPTTQMVMWGFINQFLATQSNWLANAFGVLLAGMLLWDIFYRGQLGVALCFLEEIWSRNLGHLFVTPLRPWEWVLSLVSLSMIRTFIAVIPAVLLAIPLYHYNLFGLGLPLIGFFVNLLIMGWWIALIVMMVVLRYGQGAEAMAWMLVFLIAPFCAVYYPVSFLPVWVQYISYLFPATYVFEGMRSIMVDKQFNAVLFWQALGLNAAYLLATGYAFSRAFTRARVRGSLLQMGE